MKKQHTILTLILLCTFQGCKTDKELKSPLILTILNDELVAYSYELKRDTLNILEYEIFNQSDDIYYINNLFEKEEFFTNSVHKNGISLRIFDEKNLEIEYDKSIFPLGFNFSESKNDSIYLHKSSILRNLEIDRNRGSDHFWYYSTLNSKHSFFIHPKEKIFLKMYLNLSDTIAYEDARLNFAKIYSNEKYNAFLQLASDSSNYRKVLPNHILKRIDENKVKVYHGIIQSNNQVPVRVLTD